MTVVAQDFRDRWPTVFQSATTWTDAFLLLLVAEAQLLHDPANRVWAGNADLYDLLILYYAAYLAFAGRPNTGTTSAGGGTIASMSTLVGSVSYDNAQRRAAEFKALYDDLLASVSPRLGITGG